MLVVDVPVNAGQIFCALNIGNISLIRPGNISVVVCQKLADEVK
jgi:hypothetical protein